MKALVFESRTYCKILKTSKNTTIVDLYISMAMRLLSSLVTQPYEI